MTLVVHPQFQLMSHQKELIKKTMAYEKSSLAANTRRTYAVMWNKFQMWCDDNGLQALPASAETISLYLASLGGVVSFSTIDSVIAAIEKMHTQKGLVVSGNQDLYRRVRKGIRREHKEKQALKQAKALSLIDLSIVCRRLGKSLRDIRDRAILTIAFFGALRRSELVGLDVEHIEINEMGMGLKLLQTKTSDEAVSIYLAKAKDSSVCPILALQDWLKASGIASGAIFRSLHKGDKLSNKRLTGHAIAELMKQRFGKDYSGHSLRRGLITTGAEKGIAFPRLQRLARHAKADTTLRYIELVEGFETSSTAMIGV